MSSIDRFAVWVILIVLAVLVWSHTKSRPAPVPAVQPTQEVAVTATQHAMVDSVQAMMARVGWRVRCYTALLSKRQWSPGGVNFTVEVDSSKEAK